MKKKKKKVVVVVVVEERKKKRNVKMVVFPRLQLCTDKGSRFDIEATVIVCAQPRLHLRLCRFVALSRAVSRVVRYEKYTFIQTKRIYVPIARIKVLDSFVYFPILPHKTEFYAILKSLLLFRIDFLLYI